MKKKSVIKVGDKVRFHYGVGPIIATVIEDVGWIGIRGRQLLRVRFSLEDPFITETEVPAEEVELVRDEAQNISTDR
jgi:hypothetical protein